MENELPDFKYHPDPVGTGAIVSSSEECCCCSKSRGFIYVGNIYWERDESYKLCPWCIADGSAAARFGASFADSTPLINAGITTEIAEEINRRTPGYESWQGEWWLSHCNDACEYLGDASEKDVRNATSATVEEWKREYNQNDDGWGWVSEGYTPGNDSALYKFKCRHCNLVLFGWDLC